MDAAGFDGVVRLLDRIHVARQGREVTLGTPAARTLFALLALRANTPVGMPEIAAALWGDTVPEGAAASVYTYVSSLRRALVPPADDLRLRPETLTRDRAGYRLHVPQESVDAHRFEARAAQARRIALAEDPAAALEQCDLALAEWTGPALGGATGPFAESECRRLELLRLDVQELRCEALVDRGAVAEAVGTLTTLAEAHPLRERLPELLMRALFLHGRQAEALEVYRRVRTRLAEDLGVEPGVALRRMHQRVLSGTGTAEVASARPRYTLAPRVVPAQIPHGTPDFVGRAEALNRLEQLGAAARHDVPGAGALVAAVVGAAGVGKTALLVHAGHRLADSFSDGQLFVDLRGFHPTLPPVTPDEALGQLLRGLGAAADTLKADLPAKAAHYRSLLAGRQALVLLDNAVDSEQVRPLLPGARGGLALVASRNKLTGLVARDGAQRIRLDVLSPQESLDLLRRVLGDALVDADQDNACRLARYCGHLPLALRIAADRIAEGSACSLADVVAELRTERDRLDALAAPEDESLIVRSVFSWSYRALKPHDARVFRLLGLHPGVEITVDEAGALLDTGPADTVKDLDVLVGRHLLESAGSRRYRFHDLMRLYAAERARQDEPDAGVQAALRRLLRWCLDSTLAVREVLTPGLGAIGAERDERTEQEEQTAQHERTGQAEQGTPGSASSPATPPAPSYTPGSYEEALAWTGRQLPTLLGALRFAVEHGLDRLAAELACALGSLCHSSSRWQEWLTTTELGLTAAWNVDDRLSLGRLHNDSGLVHAFLGRVDEAVVAHEAAVALLVELDGPGPHEQAVAANLAVAYSMLGRHQASTPRLEEALAIAQRLRNPLLEASVLESFAAVLGPLGRHEEAVEYGLRGVDLAREVGSDNMLCYALTQVGTSSFHAGRITEGIGYLTEALELWRRLGNRSGEIRGVCALAQAHFETGRLDHARKLLVELLAGLEDSGPLTFCESELAPVHDLLERIAEAGT